MQFNKPKIIKNSKLLIQVVDKEWINESGQKCTQFHWEESKDNVNLGSMEKPNKKIIQWKYDIPEEKETEEFDEDEFFNMFRRLFRR